MRHRAIRSGNWGRGNGSRVLPRNCNLEKGMSDTVITADSAKSARCRLSPQQRKSDRPGEPTLSANNRQVGWRPAPERDSFSRMSGNNLPILKGKRVTLRRPREDDFQARLRLGRDAEIFRMYGGNLSDLRPMTEDRAKRWVQRLLDRDYAWIIEAGSLVGEIRLDRVDLRDKRASLAIGIEDGSQLGKGLGSEAIALVLGYAFNILKLHRVSVRVVDYNLRAVRAYQKCGFVIEGKEREAAFVDGVWYDDVMMAVLDKEYLAMQRKEQDRGLG
jgi:RimJ/RimL family protein N-acetyltransferase